jgi:glycosyltransferase involved in cell wall biosynthesis
VRNGLSVAIAHDWLTGMRGGEKVLESFCRLFPGAPIYTLVHIGGSVSPLIESHPIRTSFVQRLPLRKRFYREYLPLFPTAVEGFDLDNIDLVISTSHCAAKAVVPTGRSVHICYCHSPMRYAWDQFDAYFGRERLGSLGHAAARTVLAWLARWDRATAGRVDRFVANSAFVAGRIARYYNRAASVLHPPVDVEFFTPDGGSPGDYFLVVSALVPYKRLEIAIEAARRMQVALRIVGTGPELATLRAIAGANVDFLGSVDASTLRALYRGARALVLPAEEDFGIAPIESLACGRPVVALGRGGALETVEPNVTGLLVSEPSPDAFVDAMSRVAELAFDPATLAARAQAFGVTRFEAAFSALVDETLAERARC